MSRLPGPQAIPAIVVSPRLRQAAEAPPPLGAALASAAQGPCPGLAWLLLSALCGRMQGAERGPWALGLEQHCWPEPAGSCALSRSGADDLLPILSFVVLRSGLPQLVSECAALEEFIHEG